MKRVLQPFLTIVLLIFYIMASFGIGVHECSASGTVNVRIFASSKSCDSIHSICCCKHHHHDGLPKHQHHSSKCCHTTIHQLTNDYDISQLNFKFSQIPIFNLIPEFISSFSNDLSSDELLIAFYNGYTPPPLIKETDPCSYHSQWRL